ncbi:hypothetical protein SAMN02745824_3442 [Parasphingorhabdus marina DSM 22363]|uniref:Uncharacterized protein n=1 Tax=Parasphingorhabdus marina DSM 22363 TaxID=1123272 RepID=A0A1N6HSM9_9SPHN|nr:hypothetical protein [Parasphingorhabdus marina]SIO22878.1 hypothetical protein SAMN02745824_3442 [Parasphingorhabdus marina DSM 22363]
MPDKMFEFDAAIPDQDEAATRRLKLAKLIWTSNRKRREMIPGFDWGEMPWDILLAAYILGAAEQDDWESAGIVSDQWPSDVARRYLDILSDKGLIEKNASNPGAEPQLPRLTEKGEAAIANWLDECAKGVF